MKTAGYRIHLVVALQTQMQVNCLAIPQTMMTLQAAQLLVLRSLSEHPLWAQHWMLP